ncbi:MAG: RNase adapter RapZ, partial [Limnobacter sp.]|nr:RNase adapter RapZ [Limnobacter sp.]
MTNHTTSANMKVVLITGMSGSGKSVALRALEDSDFYCLDNLPPSFIPPVIERLKNEGRLKVAVAVDARTGADI